MLTNIMLKKKVYEEVVLQAAIQISPEQLFKIVDLSDLEGMQQLKKGSDVFFNMQI